MFPPTMQSSLSRDDIRRRESQIGPHDEVPNPSSLSRPSTVSGGMSTSAIIKEVQEDEDMEAVVGCGQNLTSEAVDGRGGLAHARPSLPSIHSLFGIAGTGAGNESKASSVSDAAQRAGTSASSLMDIFPTPFSEYRNAPEDLSPPPFGITPRFPRLHRQSSTSLYASSSSARDSLSSSISLVTPTTNLTLDSGGHELERRESYATFAEEVERRRMSDNLPLGRRVMTLSQADEALRIRMGRNESYPSSATRQIRQGKTASTIKTELSEPPAGFAFSTSRPSSSHSASNGLRLPSHSNLGVLSRSSSPTPELSPLPSSHKRPSAETIGPRKRLRSSSPNALPGADAASFPELVKDDMHPITASTQASNPPFQPGVDRVIANNTLRPAALNRSESVPHLRHLASQAMSVHHPGGPDGQVRRLAPGLDQEARPHTVQSATYHDFSSRAGPFNEFPPLDGIWPGRHPSHFPLVGSSKPELRRRLSLEGPHPMQADHRLNIPLDHSFLPPGSLPSVATGIYPPTHARYPPYALPQPFPLYQPTTAPLFGSGSAPLDPGSDRRASLSASNLEATVALGIPHGVVLTQLPDASTKDRLGNPTVGPRYGCDFCGKTFSRPSSLKIHIYTHTGEKPYICSWPNCNRQFSVQSNLKRHAKVHHEQTGYNGQDVNLNESPELNDDYASHHDGYLERSEAG